MHSSSSEGSYRHHLTHAEGVDDGKGYYDNQEPYYTADYVTDGVYFYCFHMH